MKITLFFLLFLASFGGWAQDVIYIAPLQIGHVKPASSVKGLLKKNQISRDSLVKLTNQKIINGLKTRLPDAEFMFTDSSFLKLISDSSDVRKMNTTTSLDVINGVAGSINTNAKNKSGPTYYGGRNFTPLGLVMAQEFMRASPAKYLVMLNTFDAGTNFEIHFELYDKNFNKLYGDKFTRPSKTSGNMYFTTFLYYLSAFVESFDEELVKKIKMADSIRQ